MFVLRRLAVAATLSVPLSACLDGAGLCGNGIVSRIDAPGGALSAVLFQRDCGAATGFSTQISILRPDAARSGSGSIFIADDNHGAASVAEWGGPWVEVRWLDPHRLVIRPAPGARIFLRRGAMSGVQVTYL